MKCQELLGALNDYVDGEPGRLSARRSRNTWRTAIRVES